jgi:hypothetical protein
MEVDIVDHHQVGESIAVVIAEGSAGGPAAIGDAGLRRHIGKCSVAIVAIENVAAQAGKVKVGPAVVVVIAHRAAHGEARRGHAGLGGDIGECAVAVVVVERAHAFFSLDGHVDAGRIGEIDVRPAVAVVVDEDHAAAHRFDDVAFGGVGGVFECDARGRGDVFQLRNRTPAAFGRFCAGGWRRRREVPRAHLRCRDVQSAECNAERLQKALVKLASEQADRFLPRLLALRRLLHLVRDALAGLGFESLVNLKLAIGVPPCGPVCDKPPATGSACNRSQAGAGPQPQDA